MRRQSIKDEADRLLTEFGDGAHERARDAAKQARRRRNLRLERYFAQVALMIAFKTNKQINLFSARQAK
jgi:hypothetical protein